RHRGRHAPRRLHHHRDHLRVAGRGAPLGAGDLQSRLPGGAGGRLHPGQHIRRAELRGGSGLHMARSADQIPLMATPAGTTAVVLPALEEHEERYWLTTLKRLARRRTALFGLAVVVAVVLAAVFAPWLTPFDPLEQDINQRLKEPGWRNAAGEVHPLGTDHLGRAILAPGVFGARIALVVGLSAPLISGLLGLGICLAACFLPGQ